MNNCTCNKNDELRIVRGNAFSLRLTVRALRIDGTPVEDFDLSQANAVLKVEHLGTKTEKTFTIIGNDSVISFDNTLALGWYGLEMTGSYNAAPWRWYVEKVFCIVETNAKANIPAWAILTDDTYMIDVNTSITSGDIYQSDWAETNPQSPSYIQNKPNVVTHEEYDPTIIAINKAISDEETRAKAAEKANADNIDDIEALIPAQATPQNQLADKQYVDDGISTATATYRGAYNLVSDLSLTVAATEQQIAAALATKMTALGITPDNNDYCFVQVPTADATPTEIARVDRYKYNGTAWVFEFSLNNSGFTAAQWAALNSGITSGLVAKLGDLPTNSELTQLLNGKEDNSNKVTSLSASSTDTQYPSAKCVYDLHKQNADDIDDIEALIPAQATEQNQLADKQYVDDGISTATATYRGAYNLVSDLSLTVAATEQQIAAALATKMTALGITPDNNDYCFVQVPTADATPTEIARVDRYKYNGTAWAFEFSLNNSGFTAAQWAALNSGITSGLVTKLSDLPTISELTTLLNGKEDKSNKVTSLSAESTDTQYPSAKCVYDLHKANADDIDDIESLIPAQATPQNQLADKQYVDDGISTASATYRGAYNLVSDLELTVAATEQQIAAALATKMTALGITPDNNDYCFVQVPTADSTPTEIARVDRYKYNGTAWAFEFSLNNSGFTAAQWAALNSGITSRLVAKLSDLPSLSELTALLDGKQNTLTFDSTPTAGSSNPVTSNGIKQAIDAHTVVTDATPTEGSTNPVQSGGVKTYVDNITSQIDSQVSQNTSNISTLEALYNALQQSEPEVIQPTDTWPVASPSDTVIYRVIDRVNTPPQYYSDYMWNGTSMVLMATYNNAIDPRPKKASHNLVTSGGVFDNIGALDVSELNATENPHTIAQYIDLSAALAAVPTDYQKGGMSIKFVQSSDHKYVQFRYRLTDVTTAATFTNVSNWQGVDENTTINSRNLVESGGVYRMNSNNVHLKKRENLFDLRFIRQKSINANNTITDASGFYSTMPIYCKKGTVYVTYNNLGEWTTIGAYVNEDGSLIHIFTGEQTTYEGQNVVKFILDRDGYAAFNIGSNSNKYAFIVCEDTYPSEYVPYEDKKFEEGVHFSDTNIQQINGMLANKADLTAQVGKNLFNKNACLDGYINSSDGSFVSSSAGKCSNLIEIVGGEVYHLERPALTNTYSVAFIAADGTTRLVPLKEDGTEWNYSIGSRNVTVKAPASAKYIQFTAVMNGNGNLNQMQLEHGNAFTTYEPYISKNALPYAQLPIQLDKELEQIQETFNRKADLVLQNGKNLFDKTKCLDGYLNTNTGAFTAVAGGAYKSSALIEVTEGTVYYIRRPDLRNTNVVAFVNASNVRMKPLDENGVEFESYSVGEVNVVVKAPIGAKYIQFTVVFNNKGNVNNTQLEIGNRFTGYEEYFEKMAIPSSQQTPEVIRDIKELKENDDVIVSVATSDKIGVFSSSYFNGYCMKNHHHLNHISMFLDYIFYNYGKSGDDEVENLVRLENDEAFLGTIRPSNWNLKYGIIMHMSNSGAYRVIGTDAVFANIKNLAEAIKSLGGTPILSTEFNNDYNYYQNGIRFCEENGYIFMNWGTKALALFANNYFPGFWLNAHPSTRTGWLIAAGMLPYLKSLPHPQKSLKMFRLRNGIDATNLQNLVFDDNYSRAKRFVELGCGVLALTSGTEKYFDRLDTNNPAWENLMDEYQALQNNNSVNFGDYALLDFTIPYNRDDLTNLVLKITGSGITNAYILKRREISGAVSDTFYIAFGIEGDYSNIEQGDKFTVTGGVYNSSLLGEYTVEGIVDGMLITSTSGADKTTNGTDTPTITSSDFDVSAVTLVGSYKYPSYQYLTHYSEPIGEWTEFLLTNGEANLYSYISTCVSEDKFAILLKGSSIALTDACAVVSGKCEKKQTAGKVGTYKKGVSIINDELFDDNTSWDNISNIPTYDNTATRSVVENKPEALPTGISTVKILQSGVSTKQDILSGVLVQDSIYEPIKIQCRVVARYFPKYINSDAEWSTSEITEQSFDVAKLGVYIGKSQDDNKPTKVAEVIVGAYWDYQIFDTFINPNQAAYVMVRCDDKKVQIAKLELEMID